MTIQQMEERLKMHFNDALVAVVDLTGTEDHFEVRIQSPTLKSLSRVDQHKKVMAAFAAELKTGEVHALSIRVL